MLTPQSINVLKGGDRSPYNYKISQRLRAIWSFTPNTHCHTATDLLTQPFLLVGRFALYTIDQGSVLTVRLQNNNLL